RPFLIAPTFSTPSEGSQRKTRRELPPDLLSEVSRRFAIMSLVSASLWLIGDVTGHLAGLALNPSDPRWRELSLIDAIAAAAAAVSLSLFWYVRAHRRDPKQILTIGLSYTVFTSVALASMMHLEPHPPGVPI